MSDGVTISIIGAMTTVVVSVINLVLAISSGKRGQRNEDHLVELKNQTNGLQEKLIQAVGTAEYAKGVKSETDKK
jgi:hypothetical protein